MERQEYEMEYRCANCGQKFKVLIRKGEPARGAAGTCPNCGAASGRPGIGHHEMTWPSNPLSVGNQEILHG